MQRRDFLKAGLVGSGGLLLGNSLWTRVFAATATDDPNATSSYGALGDPDPITGIAAPPGFANREIARANLPVRGANGLPVGRPGYTFPVFPDGAHVFPVFKVHPHGKPHPRNKRPLDGWILVVNSENPPGADFPFLEQQQDLLGGASAIRFDKHGNVVDAYRVLEGTRTNCAGGATPWGSWLSGEEYDETTHVPANAGPLAQRPSEAGQIWECDPTGAIPGAARPALGRFKHEAAAFDDRGRVYLTEDTGDGCLYRFTPAADAGQPGSLDAGVLQAMKVTGSSVSWVPDPDPTTGVAIDAGATAQATRLQAQAAGATPFSGGEGCWFHPHASGGGGTVYFTTKGDDVVRAYDTATATIEVVYDDSIPNRLLNGVDNIIVSPHTGNVYVAEDGDNMEVIVIEDRDGSLVAAPILRMSGPQQGLVNEPNPTPVPLESEITGPTISPDGTRLYFSSQREFVFGATYELKAGLDEFGNHLKF